MKFLIKLYPAQWRQRYAREMEALLEDSRSHDAWDLLRGAMEIQMKTWSFGRIVTVCGIAGVVLAGIFAFSRPYPYRSTATLKISQMDSEAFLRVTEAAFTRQALTNILDNQNLYQRERRSSPMKDVVDEMRRAISVRPLAPDLVQVSFAYEDPALAQRVTRNLLANIVDAILYANVESLNRPGQRIELVVPADQAKRQIEGNARVAMTGLGLPAGLLFGVVLALVLRRRAPIR
jgi:hypothetical protein